jgi:ribosomal protein S18 acetylase RimI-like enzyme
MKIRRITRFSKKVFEAALKLLLQLAPDAELISENSFKSLLASKDIYFFIGELDNKEVAGILTIGTMRLLSGKKFWIEDVVVDESHRGKGYGKELMLHAINFLQDLGATSVMLTSRPSRVAANKLYSELGFMRYETNVYKMNMSDGYEERRTRNEEL